MALTRLATLLAVSTLLGCAVAVHTGGVGVGVSGDPRRAVGRGGPADPRVRELIERVNDHRERRGCPRLVWSPRIAGVAQAHSEDMARRRYFSHESPDGRSPFDRLERAGIDYRRAAENIAAGQRTAREVLETWLDSPGHRENLEDCRLTQHGIGYHDGRWTHVFVRPPDAARARSSRGR